MPNPSSRPELPGITALIALAAVYGLMPVFARYLGTDLGLFEQWYLRFGLSFIFTALIFHRLINWRKFLHLPRREWGVILLRAVLSYLIALPLFTVAAQTAKIGPVTFMQVVPTIAIFAVLFFHERLTMRKALLVLVSFLGAAMVVVGDPHDLLSLSRGELLSLVSGALFSFGLLTRRWHTGVLNNAEIGVIIIGIAAISHYGLALATAHRVFVPLSHWTLPFIAALIAAGLLSAAVNFLMNYGFEHVSPILAGNIMSLEEVFGSLFGLIFYHELLQPREIAGGLTILISVVLMNSLSRRGETPAIPVD